MRILFIYNRVDNTLKDRVKRLREHGASVSTLSLLEYKLEEDGKIVEFDIDSKLDFLEGKSKLQIANRILKRKKLLSYLEDYDIIDIYKCEKSVLGIVSEIENLCYCYFVTPSFEDTKPSLIKKPLYKNLYNKAKYIFFPTQDRLNDFTLAATEKLRLICEPVDLFYDIDEINDKDLVKATHTMGLDLDKDIIYCDLSGDLLMQLDLIDDISLLKKEKLKKSTFIFSLGRHDLDSRNRLKEKLLSLNFDYLLIEALMNQKQKALIHKLCNKAIISTYSEDNPSLPAALYSKNFIYLYDETKIDSLFFEHPFFMKDFSDFIDENGETSDTIELDRLSKNKLLATKFFEPEHSIQEYIEVIKSV